MFAATANLKQRFPFRIGTTSYIVPADILPNVTVLCECVDDVELLIFESDEISNLPSHTDVNALARIASEHALTYTVHLPVDLRLGSSVEDERVQSVQKCLRVIERMDPLKPFGYIVHFSNSSFVAMTPMATREWQVWRNRLDQSVRDLLAAGVAPHHLCVETLSYDFERIAPVVEVHGLAVCLDIGHILMEQRSVNSHLDRHLARTRVVHAHGVHDGKDHLSLAHLDPGLLGSLVERLGTDKTQTRVVTMEVFNQRDFIQSCETLARLMN